VVVRIAILYTDDRALARGRAVDALAVREALEAAECVAAACRERGFEGVLVPAPSGPTELLAKLRRSRADLVFHLVESVHGEARFEAAVAWLLEWARIPYTGTPPVALSLALEKPLARAMLAQHGVRVPEGRVLEQGDEPLGDLRPPWIVKPTREDASHGIDLSSVVHTPDAVRERARRVIQRYGQPALVEEFVDGREFNVGILENDGALEVLPLAEIDFTGFPRGKPRVVTFRAKWVESSRECKGTEVVAARDLSAEHHAAICQTAVTAYRAIGLRDYGRVDLRLSDDGRPFVIDVNPNPDLAPECGLARAAARGGLAYADLIERILTSALARARGPAPALAR
jgi:D-alanine-D-alanine ligase